MRPQARSAILWRLSPHPQEADLTPIVADPTPAIPTNLAPLPRLLAYAQSLGLERHLDWASCGIPTLALALTWLALAWRGHVRPAEPDRPRPAGSGRPEHADRWQEPLLAAPLGWARLPCARILRRSLARFSAKGVRAALETASRAELPRRAGRIWVSIDSHQVPYWDRVKKAHFHKGWSGSHGRAVRGCPIPDRTWRAGHHQSSGSTSGTPKAAVPPVAPPLLEPPLGP